MKSWSIFLLMFLGFCQHPVHADQDKVNATLIFGLIITHVLIAMISVSHFQTQDFFRTNWQDSVFSIPLIATKGNLEYDC